MGISQWKKTVQWRVDDQPHLFTVLIESLSVFRLTTSTYEFHFCLNLFHISLFLVTFVNHLWYAQFFFTQCGEVEFFPTFEVMKKVTINVVGHIDLSFPGGASSKEPAYQCRRHKSCRFDPWIGKTPWRRKWQVTPVFLPGKSHEQRSLMHPWGHKESDMT